jgi:bidirectional [NiFe] hydrogenase diaphorase subunit
MPDGKTDGTVVTLRINGKELSARDDQTIMEAAEENGINIPALCHIDGLTDVGACRLCVVEIQGNPRLLPACVTRVTEGMEVETETEKLRDYRRLILSMLFTERNHICSVCVSNGHCELQNLAIACGLEHVQLPYRNPKLTLDASHERFVHDPNRCVLCTRCVRVCEEIEGAHTWDLMGRGIETRVITDMHEAWGDSESCTRCGKCVNVCPTGALFEKGKSVAEMSKHRQFLPYLTLMREVKR